MRSLFRFAVVSLLFAAFLFGQQQTAITVTNSNLALVKEERVLNVKSGVQTINLTDVPSGIQPTSVLVESKNNAFRVLEQNYEYDLINVQKVLNKFIDRQIVLFNPQQGETSGKLLAVSSGNIMLLDDEGHLQIVPKNDKMRVVLKDFSLAGSNFLTRPTLVWRVEGKKAGQQPAQITYLTNGLNWNADYVGKLNKDDTRMTLAGWVTINNQSGKFYKNARIKLMAGQLHLPPKRRRAIAKTALRAMAAESFTEKEFFEYHLYTLQWPTDLKNNQVKQIQFFPETRTPIKKVFRVDPYMGQGVHVILSFKNSKQNNLGMALPAGTIRLYKEDGKDLEFIGEDRIDHTPKDEEINIRVGKAFDLIAERREVKTKKITSRSQERTIKFLIRNHKKETVSVEVLERINSSQENKLISSNIKPAEIRADYFKFLVTVAPNKEQELNIVYNTSW